MCKCTPEIKTPFCGKGDCQWPAQPERPAPRVFSVGGLSFQRLMSGSVRIGEGGRAIIVTASEWNALVADLARAAEPPRITYPPPSSGCAYPNCNITGPHHHIAGPCESPAEVHRLCGCSACASERGHRAFTTAVTQRHEEYGTIFPESEA